MMNLIYNKNSRVHEKHISFSQKGEDFEVFQGNLSEVHRQMDNLTQQVSMQQTVVILIYKMKSNRDVFK
jgi:hypothetical protein